VTAETQSGLRSLLTVSQLSQALGLSSSWIYRRTGPKAVDPVPVVRLGKRGVRFDPDQIPLYIRSSERHAVSDKLDSSKAAQERLGHSRPDILLKIYTHVLDASADEAAATLSQGLCAKSAALGRVYKAVS